MTDAQKQALRDDFLEWSGGDPPYDKHQITVYVDYAANATLDTEEVRAFLTDWMNEDWD